MARRLTLEEECIVNDEFSEYCSDNLSCLSLADIFYLSCLTNVSYHKIFGYYMSIYLKDIKNNDFKFEFEGE